MNIKIENMIVGNVTEMLFDMKLKGKKSRHRTRFIQFLNEHLEKLQEHERQLVKDYVAMDENGDPVMSEDGENYIIKEVKEYEKEIQELQMEKVVFGGEENQETIKTIRQILDECDMEFSGYDATVYNHLCELFKVDEVLDEDEQENEEE